MQPHEDSRTRKQPRIWICDDDRSGRFVLAEALRDAGFAVQAFDGAPAALAALDTEASPALVFTDIRMPGKTGMEAAQVIGSKTHIVFVTAYDTHAVEAF